MPSDGWEGKAVSKLKIQGDAKGLESQQRQESVPGQPVQTPTGCLSAISALSAAKNVAKRQKLDPQAVPQAGVPGMLQ